MLTENRSHLQRYGVALLAVAIAVILTLRSGSLLQPTPTPLFFAAVTLSVWYGGLGSGLLATVLSVLSIHYFFIPPLYGFSFRLDDLLRLGIFALVVLLCNSPIEAYRRGRAALAKKEELLRLITDALPTPVSYVDTSLRYRFNNQAYENWFGISRQEITGKHIKEVLGESSYQILQPKLTAVLNGETVTFEGSMPLKYGSVRYVDGSYIPDCDRTGKVKGFVALINDISKRKQAELELQEARDRLEKRVAERTAELTEINAALQNQIRERKQAETQLRFQANVLSQVTDVVLAVDNNFRIIYWNQAAEKFYGVTAEYAIGRLRKEVYEYLWLTPEAEQATWQQLESTGYWSGELIHILKSGEQKWVEVTVSALKDTQGSRSGYLAVIRDITARKQAEENRAQLIREQAARAAAEATQWRLNFLAQTSRLLATSLDYQTTLANVAQLTVPELADWCIIETIEDDGLLHQIVMLHQDIAKQNLMRELCDRYQLNGKQCQGFPKVIQTGEPELISEISDDLLARFACNAEHLKLLRQLNLKSQLCVPLKARGQLLGVLTLATAESGRIYQNEDLSFAIDLAERIGLAVDNARLYQQAQKALQKQAESLALIDALLAAAPVGIGFLDRDLRYIRVNQVLADINGFPIEQHLGRQYAELLPSAALRFESQLQQVLDTGISQLNVEYSGEAPGQPGRLGYWLANRYPVRSAAGEIVGIGVIVADITETKRTAQALQEAEERLRVAIKNSPMMVFNQDLNLRYTWIYNLALDISSEVAIGKTDFDLMLHDDASYLATIKRQVLETGIGSRQEVKITRKRNYYYDLTVEPLQNVTGEIIGITCAAVDISDRKQAELALQRSEERYRAFIEQSTEGIWRFELEIPLPITTPEEQQIQHFYRYTYLAECNNVFAQMYGYTEAEELVGSRLDEFLIYSDPRNIEYLLSFIRQGYRVSERESHELDREGNLKCFSNNLVGIIENGYLVRAWGTQRDITERKRTESMLRYLVETSSFLSTSLEYEATLQRVAQLPVPYLADWCATDILQSDGTICRMPVICADPEKIELARKLEQYPPDPNGTNPIAKVMRTGIPELIPEISDKLLASTTRDAEHLSVVRAIGMKSATIVPLVVEEEVFGTMTFVRAETNRRYNQSDLALAIDLARRAALAIDNAKLYQEARSQRQRAERARERTASLFAITAAFSESLTPTQVAEVVVNRGITTLGAIAGSIVSLDENNHLKPLATVGYPAGLFDDSNSPTFLADTVFAGQPIFLENPQAFRTQYPNSGDFLTITRSSAFAAIPLTVAGRTIGALALSFTYPQEFSQSDRAFMLALGQQCAQALARARLYEAEQRARSQAEAANRIKDEFLAVLSHELRTPLNPILGWVKLLRTRNFDAAKTAQALETIERNAKLQTQLIEDLLDVSRIIQGKLNLNICSVNLVSTIEAALETIRLAAEAKSIQIQTIFAPKVGKVWGDPNRLQQVVWNLLSNAVKFTPSGGKVEVRLAIAPEDKKQEGELPLTNYAQIEISDTGKGIDPNFLPYVFDYFRQENSSTTRTFGGLGLGLAIVRHLVELHGGSVAARSPGEGLGATFTVRLPLHNSELENPRDRSFGKGQDALARIENSLDGLKILVVDDEADTRNLLTLILEEYKAKVLVVASANEALEKFSQWQPDLLLSDIGMPGKDGYALIEEIRAMPPNLGGEIPAIALSAYAGETNREKILKAGFNKHLAKPVEPVELIFAIVEAMGNR